MSELSALRQVLSDRFDEGELRTLCFELGLDYDELPYEGKANKARELVTYMMRRDRIHDLLVVGQSLRPDIDWSALAAESGVSKPTGGGVSAGAGTSGTGGGVTFSGQIGTLNMGDIVGGNKVTINSSNVYMAGGDLFVGQPVERDALVAELEKLREALVAAAEDETLDQEAAGPAAALVEAAAGLAQEPQADANKITRRLRQAVELLEEAAVGAGAAAGLIAAIDRAIDMVQQLFG